MDISFKFPNLDKDLNVDNLIDQTKIEQKYSRDLARWINTNDQVIKANSFDNVVNIIKKGMQAQTKKQDSGFVDLKEAFARSPKAKTKKDGGWYLIIPIGQKASQLKSAAPRSLWNQLSGMDFGQTGQMEDSDGNNLLDDTFNNQNTINPLSYQWQSSSVTRVAPKTGSGRYGHYISFRTVSDKSSPSSWIMGRNNFNDQNTAPQQQTDIAVYLRHAMEQFRKSGEFNIGNS